MTPAERTAEWLHFAKFCLTDESRFALWASLKKDGSPPAREALEKLVMEWLKK